MKTLIAATVIVVLCGWRVSAHPPSAIVVDDRQSVYFAYWNGTWKLDAIGQRSRVHANDFHFLAIDAVGRFARAAVPDTLRLTPDGSRPVLFSFPEFPATFHSDGDLYLAPWSVGRIRVDRVTADGRRTRFVDAPIDPRLARTPGRHEGGVLTIASGPRGLYVSDGASIWTIDAKATVSPVALNVVVPGCPSDLPAELPRPHIRSLAVDATGDVYAAAIGCRATVKISAAGRVAVVLRAENPWTPSGVAIGSGGVYVMEYDNALAEYPVDGRPRIRHVARDGAVKTLIVADRQS